MTGIKNIIAGLLLVGIALALSINTVNPLVTVPKGGVADFEIQITNYDQAQNVLVTADSKDVYTSISEPSFHLDTNKTKTIHVFGVTNGLGEGVYLIKLNINGQVENLAVNVQEGVDALKLTSVYEEVSVMQGETQDLKFIIRNEGNERLRNIVIEGTIPEVLNPKYPEPFDLDPNEVKELKIRITVPIYFPADEYELTVKAGSGNVITQADFILNIEGAEPLTDRLDMKLLLPWEPVKEETGKIIGYELSFRIKNRGISDLNNVEWKIEGLPEGWEVSGNEPFSIEGYETKTINLTIIPTSFSETPLNISLIKDDSVITKEQVVLAGYKIGMPTGMAFFGGSTLIGAVIIIALVIALLYIRSRNAEAEKIEEQKTRDYLEKLVEKAKKEAAKKKQ